MSERKSWDVQPKRKAGPATVRAPQAAPKPSAPRQPHATESMQDIRASKRPQSRTNARPTLVRGRTPAPKGSLTERRKSKKRTVQYVAGGLTAAVLALLMYGVWQPTFRITQVEAHGPGAEQAQRAAQQTLSGRYAYVLPRNSVFLLPIEQLRAGVLTAVPEASAVSISRTSFTSLSIETTSRAEAFVWCGTTIDMPRSEGCYHADSEGLIFALVANAQSESEQPASTGVGIAEERAATTTGKLTNANVPKGADAHGTIRIFGDITPATTADASPIGSRVISPGAIPDALKFVDALRELGAPVTSVAIRGDEADVWLGGPTHIMYVLGKERDAVSLAASTLPALNLKNGSIQYVDLRFPGKAYVKRFGEQVAE